MNLLCRFFGHDWYVYQPDYPFVKDARVCLRCLSLRAGTLR